jgi:hypothetical protein
VPGIAHGNTTEGLYPLGNRVDQLDLLAGMFIEQQVELALFGPTHPAEKFLGPIRARAVYSPCRPM